MLSTKHTINTEEAVNEDAYFQHKFKELTLHSSYSNKDENQVSTLSTNELNKLKNNPLNNVK